MESHIRRLGTVSSSVNVLLVATGH
jgi:hypothetical protein